MVERRSVAGSLPEAMHGNCQKDKEGSLEWGASLRTRWVCVTGDVRDLTFAYRERDERRSGLAGRLKCVVGGD